jgi:hypothetical protein
VADRPADDLRTEADRAEVDRAEVDRVALFLLRTRLYGKNVGQWYVERAAMHWNLLLTDDDLEGWRTHARTLLSEAGWRSVTDTRTADEAPR